MEPIYEQTWRVHIATGTVLEEDLYGEYRMIGVEVTQQVGLIHYKYRLLFFPIKEKYPVLAVNLERSLFTRELGGAYFLGLHDASGHANFGFALDGRENISYDEFRDEAWKLAEERLDLTD
jgi:hypothetical protein